MLRLLGSPKTLCDGFTRRDFLHVGGLGALGVGLGDLLRLRETQAAQSRSAGSAKAKACILLFPYGSPAQHETFDPKPDAPVEIQGEMKAIATSVPGVHIAEGLPKVAQVVDRMTIVRSMTHRYPLHGVAYALSGLPEYSVALETRPRDARHWPFIGSVVDYLEQRRTGEATPEMPRNVGLPWQMTSKTDIAPLAGPYAAFLGQQYDPIWTDFVGKGTKIAPPNTESQKGKYYDPHMGITSEGRFQLSPRRSLPITCRSSSSPCGARCWRSSSDPVALWTWSRKSMRSTSIGRWPFRCSLPTRCAMPWTSLESRWPAASGLA